MRWERQKPLRPLLAALGLLFVLVLAAPRSWQGHASRQTPQTDSKPAATSTQVEPSTTDLATVKWASELPAESAFSGTPELAFPELVLAAPPLPQPEQSILLRPSSPQVAEALPVRKEQVAEALPVRKEFDLDVLRQVRDNLLAVLDQLPAVELPVTPTPLTRPQPAPVRVTSENDRLAMVVPRRILPRVDTPDFTPPKPKSVAPIETTQEEVADFAAILLETAQNPSTGEQRSIMVPRLARRIVTPNISVADQLPIQPFERQSIAMPRTLQAPISQSDLPPESLQAVEPQPVVPEPIKPLVKTIKPLPPVLTHRPQALLEQLADFPPISPGAIWSQQVLAELHQLTKESTGERSVAFDTLARLEQLYEIGLEQSGQPNMTAFHNHWKQTAQALGRRLTLWHLLADPHQPKVIRISSTITNISPALSAVAELFEQQQNGNAWREYLLLERLVAATNESKGTPALARTKLAQEVLSRMQDSQLTAAQLEFIKLQPLVDLQLALRPWAAGKVNLETLSALIERYESGREMRYAVVIAQLQQRLSWSVEPHLQTLAAQLDTNYRAANMRIAMSDDLLNRMMPKQKEIVSPVNAKIAGAKVKGRARTTTQTRISLVPDAESWHFDLMAFGKVYSDTRSDTWPARIRNAAKMEYKAHKEITLDPQGLHTTPTRASAKGRNELLGVDSKLDPVPILGYMLRDIARKKHKKSRPQAIFQAKANVVRQVKSRMDSTLEEKLEKFEGKFRDNILAPMEELALLAEPLDMHTTEQRAVMELRLANPGQLAAHTLRPLAPSDSVLSVQMHESALNNAMMGFGLDGRRMTMLELFDFFAERFGKTSAVPPEDLPRRAVIQFAKRDSVRIKCDGDRLELILSVKELSHRRDKIKNFQIHVHFRPQLEGLDVRLVREGSLQFSGRRLKTGPRFALHSILGKVLAKDLNISLVNAKLMQDQRLEGLMVTQLVIEAGWIGLALGPAHPRRTALRGPWTEVLSTPFVR